MQSLLCLGTCLLAFLSALPVFGAASELQWGKQHTTMQKPALKTSLSTPAPRDPAPTTSVSSSLRFVRPQTSLRHTDADVRVAAFEEEAPRLTSGRDADSQTRSLVVNRDDASNDFRSAQLPPVGSASSNASNPPELPQLETPSFDLPPMPEENATPPATNQTLPPPETNNTLQFDQRQRQPAQNPPTRDPLQPVLPSGPTPPEGTGPPAPVAAPPAEIEAENVKAKESCSKSLENLRAYTVDKVNLNISVAGNEGTDYPFECSVDDGTQQVSRCWDQTTYMWKASAMCHKPLYFEDEQLERYGHSFSPCFQPFISGAHFFCTLPVLPYCMGVEPPCECIYALGHYRPNSCAPYMCNPIPLSLRGAVFEAGAVWGTAAVLP